MPLGSFRLNSLAEAISAALEWTLTQSIGNPIGSFSGFTGQLFGQSVHTDGTYTASVGLIDRDALENALSSLSIIDNASGSVISRVTYPNPNGTFDDLFRVVKISGNNLIAGNYTVDEPSNNDSGEIHHYTTALGDWTDISLVRTIANPNSQDTAFNDRFGYDVDVDSTYLYASAPREKDLPNFNSGVIYIFEISTGNLIHTIVNPNNFGTSDGDIFAWSFSVNGNQIAVGAYGEDITGSVNGIVYIFETTLGDWSDTALIQTIVDPVADGGRTSQQFGYELDFKGNTLIVGQRTVDTTVSNIGRVNILQSADWSLGYTSIPINNPTPVGNGSNDQFGSSVAVSGDYAVVGASQTPDAINANSGKAYIYNVSDGSLLLQLDNPNTGGGTSGDSFGVSVSISGNYISIGASGDDFNGGAGAGYVHIYKLT